MSNSTLPVVVVINSSVPSPGSNVQVTAVMNVVDPAGQVVNIAGSPGGFFSSLPATANVPPGSDRVTFGATVSTSASGAGSVTASCNGGQAVGNCLIPT